MKFIRKILYKLLGLKGFVSLVSRIYLLLVKKGFLKKKYPELFFLEKIIKPGFTCIDIGANVGYYSVMLARYSGLDGKVFAVEPIPVFAEIWKKNLKRSGYKTPELFVCALGGEEKNVKMGVPQRDGVVHHGMTKIVGTANEKYIRFFDVQMQIPNKLFSEIENIDFIKCDVEGYESEVFSNMNELIEKHKPLVQSELSGQENRKKVIDLFEKHGYKKFHLKNNKLTEIQETDIYNINSDFYFINKNSKIIL
jgi:FkbM family methyltransferase